MAKPRRGERRTTREGCDPPGLARCVRDATYPDMPVITSGVGRYFWLDGHRRAAETYARRFHAEHGRLPKGTHHVVLPPAFEADIRFPVRLRRSSSPR